jgi:signal peptidase I
VLRFVVWVAGILGIVLVALYLFAFDVWTVPSDDPFLAASLAPTLAAGDVVILSRHPSVARGDLLRCPDPQAAGRFVVARAIAGGGESIAFIDEVPFVDGHHTPTALACPDVVFQDPSSGHDVQLACGVEEFGEMTFQVLQSATSPAPSTKTPRTVDPGAWFIVSDNRHFPVDSRVYGPIKQRLCQHVIARVKGEDGIGVRLIW